MTIHDGTTIIISRERMSALNEAVGILRRMEQVVKADRLVHNAYIEDGYNPAESEPVAALCNGYKFCAVGSLYVAAGVAPERDDWNNLILPGQSEELRDGFLADKPALKLAYDTLNQVAAEWVDKKFDRTGEHVALGQFWHSMMERLFEGGDPSFQQDDEGWRNMCKLVRRARRRLERAVVTY